MNTIKVYSYNELSEEAKEAARDWWRRDGPMPGWWEPVYEDAAAIAELLGIQFDKRGGLPCVYFEIDGGADGVSYDGCWSYKKGSRRLIRGYAPNDDDLYQIAIALAAAARTAFYDASASVKSGTRAGAMAVDVSCNNELAAMWIETALRDFAGWILSQLRKELEYILSDISAEESLIANGWYFFASGAPCFERVADQQE